MSELKTTGMLLRAAPMAGEMHRVIMQNFQFSIRATPFRYSN